MAVLGREARISGPGEDILVAVLSQEVRISGPGEDIWMAVSRREVRISGSGEDIWMAVLGQEVMISGLEVVGMGVGGRREVRTRSRGCARIYARPLAVGIWEVKGAPSRSTKILSKT